MPLLPLWGDEVYCFSNPVLHLGKWPLGALVMQVGLVRSKLMIPSPTGLLHRPRVCDVIEQGLECKLTLVTGPPGYGKTAALIDFARHSPVPVCWYTADERDRDLGMFVAYLVGAIAESFADFGERTRTRLASSTDELFHNPAAIADELVNEIVEIDKPFAIVVDNYELLDGGLGIRAFVHRLLRILPANCHLMLGSRTLPDVPITWLVAKRQLVGLTARDLGFRSSEIKRLLAQMQIEVSDSQAEAVVDNSEGWVTGALLLADLVRDEGEALFTKGKATVETYRYFAREVLERQPPDVQRFLRTSAVLREMSPWMCRQVLRIQNPRGLLAEVERRNLFITRFGEGGAATYRYHSLFRDFLHEQLQRREPALGIELHLRAARHFEQEGDIDEAVYHYLAAEAHDEAVVLMERVAMEWFTRGRIGSLLSWASSLPEGLRSRAPRLFLYQSRVLTDRGEYQEAQRALVEAEAGFQARRDTVSLAKVHTQRATLALFDGRYDDAMNEARVALGMLGAENVMERAGAQRHIGRACIGLGHLDEGIAELQSALVLYRQVGSPYDVVNLLQDLVLALTAQGDLEQAMAYLGEALPLCRRLDAPALLAGVLNNLGYLHYLRAEYREALALYEEGLMVARRGDIPWLQANILAGMGDLYRDVGDFERAEPFYDASLRAAQASRPRSVIYVLTAWSNLCRWRGEGARARALLEKARRLVQEKGLGFEERVLLDMAEGITLAEDGHPEEGVQLLRDTVRALEQRQAGRDLAQARFLLAKGYLLAGDRSRAVVELSRAVELAGKLGLQFVAAEGRYARPLLEAGSAAGLAACREIAERGRQIVVSWEESAPEPSGGREACRLEVYAFGEARVVRDGHVVTPSEWRAATARELFYYILVNGPLGRDAIGAEFWPELTTRGVKDNFHNALYRVRRALGTDVVVSAEGRYRLGDVDYWFDVEEFETLVERARLLPPQDWQAQELWNRALALYRGDFLTEAERPWVVPKRETLRDMYVTALVGMGECHEARGWYKRALDVAKLREDIHRRIMSCYANAGRRAEALAQYDRCREALRRDLGVEPSTETTELYRQIADRSPDQGS